MVSKNGMKWLKFNLISISKINVTHKNSNTSTFGFNIILFSFSKITFRFCLSKNDVSLVIVFQIKAILLLDFKLKLFVEMRIIFKKRKTDDKTMRKNQLYM